MALVQDEHVIQALLTHAAKEPFAEGVDPRRLVGGAQQVNVARRRDARELRTKFRIVVVDEELGCSAEGRRLAQLLSYPRVGRMPRHVDVDDPP